MNVVFHFKHTLIPHATAVFCGFVASDNTLATDDAPRPHPIIDASSFDSFVATESTAFDNESTRVINSTALCGLASSDGSQLVHTAVFDGKRCTCCHSEHMAILDDLLKISANRMAVQIDFNALPIVDTKHLGKCNIINKLEMWFFAILQKHA